MTRSEAIDAAVRLWYPFAVVVEEENGRYVARGRKLRTDEARVAASAPILANIRAEFARLTRQKVKT